MPWEQVFKLNIDGSFQENNGKGGLGEVIRDSLGLWILGYSKGMYNTTNILAETLALMHGVQIALERNLLPLTIETDCKDLLHLLINNAGTYSNLINDCRWLLIRAGDPILQHNYREANGVADAMAKHGCSLLPFEDLMQYQSPPSFVVPIYEKDFLGTKYRRTVNCCNDVLIPNYDHFGAMPSESATLCNRN